MTKKAAVLRQSALHGSTRSDVEQATIAVHFGSTDPPAKEVVDSLIPTPTWLMCQVGEPRVNDTTAFPTRVLSVQHGTLSLE